MTFGVDVRNIELANGTGEDHPNGTEGLRPKPRLKAELRTHPKAIGGIDENHATDNTKRG
jgi:hypothetical protein